MLQVQLDAATRVEQAVQEFKELPDNQAARSAWHRKWNHLIGARTVEGIIVEVTLGLRVYQQLMEIQSRPREW